MQCVSGKGDTVKSHIIPWQNKVTVPSKGDTARKGIQGIAAGGEADENGSGIGDTVAASSSMLNLMQK